MASPVGQPASLVPELDVYDLDASLRFYLGVIGFALIFERARERFAYLGLTAPSSGSVTPHHLVVVGSLRMNHHCERVDRCTCETMSWSSTTRGPDLPLRWRSSWCSSPAHKTTPWGDIQAVEYRAAAQGPQVTITAVDDSLSFRGTTLSHEPESVAREIARRANVPLD